MIVSFFLLGSFEVQVGSSARQAVGDTIASKILAYLAFRNQFSSRDDIVRACWGPNKVTGRDKLEDEAYQRQISNLRSLLTSMGVTWQDHLLAQPNGLQLREGTFTTDLMRFDELIRLAFDPELLEADRLKPMQEADSLRRGYLLDGMNCEWIVSEDGGARNIYSQRVQQLRRELLLLQTPRSGAGAPPKSVIYFDGFYDVIPQLRAAIASAVDEIILFGISLHLTVSVIQDVLLERVRSGVPVRILLLDPDSPRMLDYAKVTANDAVVLRQECELTIRRLAALAEQTSGMLAARAMEVMRVDTAIQGRLYAIDPKGEHGQVFYFPYLSGVTPVRVPGYFWQPNADIPYSTHLSQLSFVLSTKN